MKNLILCTLIVFCSIGSYAGIKKCDLSFDDKVVVDVAVSYSACSYLDINKRYLLDDLLKNCQEKVDRLSDQYPGKTFECGIPHSVEIPAIGNICRNGNWEATIYATKDSKEIKKEVCKKIAVCLVEASPSENTKWLEAKETQLKCN